MKNIYISILLIISLISFQGCEKDDFVMPMADFEIYKQDPITYVASKLSEPYQVSVGDALTFKFLGQGQSIVFWYGEKKSIYSQIGITEVKGAALSENETSRNYTYTTAGNFTIVCIASSYRYKPEKFEQVKLEKAITVNSALVTATK